MALTENIYTGDGSTVLYSFTFPYIETTDVKVQFDGVTTTSYSLANATTVELVAAPTSGTEIRIYRDTEVDTPAATFFPGSAIRAQDLNDNFEQNLFVIQEADFNNTQSAADSAAALATAQAADTKADQANVQSAAAQASAAQAQTDATQAAIDAATAQADATQAATDASAAQISADQANAAVQAAAVFAPVVNVAAIPSSPADQDRVSVKDSTGIGSFTPLTGLPVGPIYDSGVYVNLVYQSTGATWEFVAYGPNDPDSRYLLDVANSVNTSNVSDDAITTDKIVDAAVTPAKLDRTYVETVGGTMTGDLTVPSLNGGQLAGFRNVIINGAVTINQREVTYAAVAVGDYWADRWKKTAGGMTQIVEDGNYKPSTTYTLSGTGVTTQTLTSPASGNWTIPDVPSTATMIQLEEGTVATPFEYRPISIELTSCYRYYVGNLRVTMGGPATPGVGFYTAVQLPVRMSSPPTYTLRSVSYVGGASNLRTTSTTADYADFECDNSGTATIANGVFSADAEL